MFDLLLKSHEAMSAQQVAQELGTSVDGTERLLDALVGIEILEVEKAEGTGEEEEDLYNLQYHNFISMSVTLQLLFLIYSCILLYETCQKYPIYYSACRSIHSTLPMNHEVLKCGRKLILPIVFSILILL